VRRDQVTSEAGSDAPAAAQDAAAGATPARTRRSGLRWSELMARAPTWTGVGVVLGAMAIFLAVTQPLFLTDTNLTNVLKGASVNLLLAVGTTFLLTTGAVDLSIGSMLALCGMILAGQMTHGVPVALAVLGTIVAGSLLGGAVNGVLVTKAKLSFFVVTLGTLALFRSAAQIPTEGLSIELYDKPGVSLITKIGDGTILGISVPIALSLGALVLAMLVLRYTNFGRAVFAVGGNESAARLAGIAVDRVRIAVFAINGALVGLAAVILAGRIQSASPLIGVGIELEVIAAVLLGGTSFLGGSSSMLGTAIGVMFIATLQNGLNLMGVQALWQGVVTGSVLILAVWVDRIRRPG
jgi:ribose transport system permease protein